MSYQPRYDPHSTSTVAGPWAAQPGPNGPRPAEGADDGLVRLAGWMFCLLAALLAATVALVAAGVLYGLATWRRWRWWPLALTGAFCLMGVLAARGPGGALDRHLLALHELTDTGGQAVWALADARWPAWLLAQLPLGLPIGALLAALGRHQVAHVAAHELSPRARRRRDAEDHAQLAAAVRLSTDAPAVVKDRPVLGAWAGGDLLRWRSGRWCVIPDNALGLGTLLIGLPGAGKTETLLRLAQAAMGEGYDVHIIDAKGDPTTQARFCLLASAFEVGAMLFPQEAYDGFRGDPEALRNRFARIVDYTEPYYQDGARVLLAAACGTSPPRSLASLLASLETAGDVETAVRKGTLSRYRSFATAAGGLLSGSWAFEDTRASYLLLDGLALGDDTPRLARYLLEDFTHYCTARKAPERKVLLLVDEFSALRVSNAAALFERLRSFNAGVVLAAQSIEGLHDDEAERQRLVNAASTLIAHRLADPDPIVTRAGTVRRAERSHQLDVGGATGMGSLRLQDAYRIDPNELRSLSAGVAWIVTGGRAAKVAVARGGTPPSSPPPRLPARAGAAPKLEAETPSSAPLQPVEQARASVGDEARVSGGGAAPDQAATEELCYPGDELMGSSVGAGDGDSVVVPDVGDEAKEDAGDAARPAESPATSRTASPYAQGL